MKNNNIKKVMLALALAAVAVGPNIEKSHAAESEVYQTNYYEIYDNFQKALADAKAIQSKYQYINADYSNQRILNNALSEAEILNRKVSRYVISDTAKNNMAIATSDIKFALSLLNGQKATLTDLKDLLDKHAAFIDSQAFKDATAKAQRAYLDAYNEANSYYTLNRYEENSISKTKVDSLTYTLKAKKADIDDAYAQVANKEILKEEIALASKLRNDGDKYTEKSFETFKAALRLAETSVEDKSTKRTGAEYKEIAETLKSARLGLVEKEAKNERIEELKNKLKIAINKNKVAVQSAEFLLENAPKQVAPVKDKLTRILKDAKETIRKSEEVLDKLNGIKG